MIALVVTINIKPGHKEEFMASMLGDARGSNNDEPGCLRFDVLQDNEDPNRFHRCEIFRDEAAFADHRTYQHTKDFGVLSPPWIAEPLSIIRTTNIDPPDANLVS